jgi:hypothetical protein
MHRFFKLIAPLALATSALACTASTESGEPVDSQSAALGTSCSMGVAWYKRTASDNFVTGNLDTSGNHVTIGGTPGISSNWTHVVGLGGTGTFYPYGSLLFYDRASGAGAVGYIDLSGVFKQTHYWGAGSFGAWDSITQLGKGGATFFYRWNAATNTGSAALVQFNAANGTSQTLQSWSSGFGRWTSVVSDGYNTVFYNKDSGALVYGTFEGTDYHLKQYATTIATGYDLAAYGDVPMFYNSLTGRTEWFSVSTYTGAFSSLGVDVREAGFTHLVSRKGEYLFHRKSDGKAVTAKFFDTATLQTQRILWANVGWDTVTAAGDYCENYPR